MAKNQKVKSPLAPISLKILPQNRKTLEVMLHAAEKNLDFLEAYHCRQMLRLKELNKTLKEPENILQKSGFLREITEASHKHFAQGWPSASALILYVDAVALQNLFAKHAKFKTQIASFLTLNPPQLHAWEPCIVAFRELVTAEGVVIDSFRALQQRIISALERSSADKSSDNRRLSRVKLPKNPNVLHLAIKINENIDQELSQHDIALQFTAGNKKRADNLLRQLRRFPTLLSKHRQ